MPQLTRIAAGERREHRDRGAMVTRNAQEKDHALRFSQNCRSLSTCF